MASKRCHKVKKIPGDFSENDGKNARELVCFRISESLSVLEKGKSSDVSPRPDFSARISPSDCCEDVLRQVLRKLSRANQELSESEMSNRNRDVEQFVEKKRSCLPKCGLEQLKDVILKDNDLIPLSVKEKSGLLNKNYSDGNATRPERSESDDFDNPPVRDLSFGKTDVSDSANANQEGSSACNQLIVCKEYPHDNAALKRKQDAFCAQKAVEDKDSASLNERMHVDDVRGGNIQHSGREESDLLREPRVENFRDTITCESVPSKKLKMSSTVGDAELLHNQLQRTYNVEKMTQGTSGEENGLNISDDEAKKDGEGYVELRTIGSSSRVVNQGTKSADGAKENCAHSLSLAPNSVRCGEIFQEQLLTSISTTYMSSSNKAVE